MDIISFRKCSPDMILVPTQTRKYLLNDGQHINVVRRYSGEKKKKSTEKVRWECVCLAAACSLQTNRKVESLRKLARQEFLSLHPQESQHRLARGDAEPGRCHTARFVLLLTFTRNLQFPCCHSPGFIYRRPRELIQ